MPRTNLESNHALLINPKCDTLDIYSAPKYGRFEGKLSPFLWESTISLRQDTLNSGFIQALADDRLLERDFNRFIDQDSVYIWKVIECVRKLRRTVGGPMGPVLDILAKEYDEYYTYMRDELHVATYDQIELSNACWEYVRHIEHVTHIATNGTCAYLFVALLPCFRLWHWLGEQLDVEGEQNTFGPYIDWVRYNMDPNNTHFERFENLIDEAASNGLIDTNIALAIYVKSMQCEANFFNSVVAS